MAGKVADRIGLTATGLPTLTPRDIRAWLDRVRAGGLDPVETQATMLLVYRVWAIALLFKVLGSGWDVAWHFKWLRDDFAPPHNVNLVGDGIAIVLVICHWYTRFGVDRLALRLMTGGIALFVASAPIDVINHRINGLDITAWSLTHFGLFIGTSIMIAGVIRGWRLHSAELPGRHLMLGAFWLFFMENTLFPAQQQEYGVLAIRAYAAGKPTAEPILLDFAAQQAGVAKIDLATFTHFALPIPSWVYPLWLVTAVMLGLVAARRSVGLRWTATTIAGAYVAWRCLMWALLGLADFPLSTVPFLLLLGGLAIDLAMLAGLPWLLEAAVGAALVTFGVYIGAFIQSYVLAAPPISYWSAPVSALILFVTWAALGALYTKRNTVLF